MTPSHLCCREPTYGILVVLVDHRTAGGEHVSPFARNRDTGVINPDSSRSKTKPNRLLSAKTGHADHEPFCYLAENTKLRRYLPGIMMCAAVVPANINQGR